MKNCEVREKNNSASSKICWQEWSTGKSFGTVVLIIRPLFRKDPVLTEACRHSCRPVPCSDSANTSSTCYCAGAIRIRYVDHKSRAALVCHIVSAPIIGVSCMVNERCMQKCRRRWARRNTERFGGTNVNPVAGRCIWGQWITYLPSVVLPRIGFISRVAFHLCCLQIRRSGPK